MTIFLYFNSFLKIFNNFWGYGQTRSYVENLKSGNIQDTNEVLTLLLGIQSLVALLDQPFEHSVEQSLKHTKCNLNYYQYHRNMIDYPAYILCIIELYSFKKRRKISNCCS